MNLHPPVRYLGVPRLGPMNISFFLSVGAVPGFVTTGMGGHPRDSLVPAAFFFSFSIAASGVKGRYSSKISQRALLTPSLLDSWVPAVCHSLVSCWTPGYQLYVTVWWVVFFPSALAHCTQVRWLCVQLQQKPYTKHHQHPSR